MEHSVQAHVHDVRATTIKYKSSVTFGSPPWELACEGIGLAAKLIGHGFAVGLYPPPPHSARAEPEDDAGGKGVNLFRLSLDVSSPLLGPTPPLYFSFQLWPAGGKTRPATRNVRAG